MVATWWHYGDRGWKGGNQAKIRGRLGEYEKVEEGVDRGYGYGYTESDVSSIHSRHFMHLSPCRNPPD